MRSRVTRRRFSELFGAMIAGGVMVRPGIAGALAATGDALGDTVAGLETRIGARIGIAILDTATGGTWGHRADERFPMCSTFKVIACGAVLARVDAGGEDLNRRIRFAAGDVVTYSPVTKGRVGGDGMTLADLCAAAVTQSDNTAANLILRSLGGPAAVTAFARSLGDTSTRLDRWETGINDVAPDDPRDTTTPAAMAANLRSLVVGDHLSPRSRDQLAAWLVANKTGDARLRAGLPKDWRVGDKTGTGGRGTANDVAVIWPPDRQPLIVSVYVTETAASLDDRNAAIADVGRAVRTVIAA